MIPRLFLLVTAAIALPAQHSEATLTNPFQSPKDREQGGVFYRSQCASCHGVDGRGGASGPSLATGNFRRAANDEGIFRIITRGIPGTAMPGFSMNGREIWQIVGYIRSLAAARENVSGGDPAAGAVLFAANRCTNCHFLDGKGAANGLDLSSAGSRLSPAELRLALLDPSAEAAPEFWPWRAELLDGTRVTGRRLNEDTFSVQYLDRNGQLKTLMKSAIRSQALERKSPMPSFRERLTAEQIAHLVAFLSSRKGAAQ